MRFFGYFLVASQESTSPAGASPGKPYVTSGFPRSPAAKQNPGCVETAGMTKNQSRRWRYGNQSPSRTLSAGDSASRAGERRLPPMGNAE